MTDREKLIELLNENFTEYCNVDIIAGHCKIRAITFEVDRFADFLISNGVTFVTDNNVGCMWIPVSERLPEDDLPKDSKRKSIKVLVTYKTSSGVPVVRTQVREKDPWYGGNGWAWTKWEPITHWMPLPEPPKEVDK